MKSFLSTAMLLASSLVSASPILPRTTHSTSLYAYAGDTIGGLPLWYYNGGAYIGDVPSNYTSTVFNVTVSSSSSAVVVTPAESNVTWTDTKYFWINPSDGAYDSIGIKNSAPSSSYTDTGFAFYSVVFFHRGTSGSADAYFYATPLSGHNGTWAIKWNSDNDESDEDSVLVALRSQAPGKLASN